MIETSSPSPLVQEAFIANARSWGSFELEGVEHQSRVLSEHLLYITRGKLIGALDEHVVRTYHLASPDAEPQFGIEGMRKISMGKVKGVIWVADIVAFGESPEENRKFFFQDRKTGETGQQQEKFGWVEIEANSKMHNILIVYKEDRLIDLSLRLRDYETQETGHVFKMTNGQFEAIRLSYRVDQVEGKECFVITSKRNRELNVIKILTGIESRNIFRALLPEELRNDPYNAGPKYDQAWKEMGLENFGISWKRTLQ